VFLTAHVLALTSIQCVRPRPCWSWYRSLPIGFGILTGACVCLWLLSMLKGHNKELMTASSILMTAGMHPFCKQILLILMTVTELPIFPSCGALAVADRENLNTVCAILIIGSLGIGGIVVPVSIITTNICPDDLIADYQSDCLEHAVNSAYSILRVTDVAIGYLRNALY
jgi:hypothetical protein